MDYITLHAPSVDAARKDAAERFNVGIEDIECLESSDSKETASFEEPENDPGSDESSATDEIQPAFQVRVDPRFWEKKAREWIQGFVTRFGVLAEVRAQTIGTQIFLRLTCPEPSILIGRQGHTLEAIQHVVVRALTTQWPELPEVIIDVENYKEKKLQRLERTARSAVQRALRYNKPQELEPMTASERKYIHNALKDVDSVRTVSYGREPTRHVVIEPLEGAPRQGRVERPRRRNGPRHDEKPASSSLFRRPPVSGSKATPSSAPPPSSPSDVGERIDWRPTFFKPPEKLSSGGSAEPYPEVEDELH